MSSKFQTPPQGDPYVHADEIDRELGFQVTEIERQLLARAQTLVPNGDMDSWGRKLHGGSQTWVGLSPQVLQTPYDELDRICQRLELSHGAHVLDLGAGYGRLAFVLAHYDPTISFQGIELVPERVTEGNRIFQQHGLKQARLVCDDLSRADFQLPWGDVYFIYDYGNIDHIRRTLRQLRDLSERGKLQVVARGNGVRSLIEYAHPWLTEVVPAGTTEVNFSIYRN